VAEQLLDDRAGEAAAGLTPPKRYPVSAFFSDPVRAGATLSPDGTRIAYLAPENGRLNVWIEPVEGGDAVCVTHDHRRGVRSYRWTADPRWMLYVQDDDGDENWHVLRVDLEDPTSRAVDLTPFPGVTVEYELLAGEPPAALITMNLRDRGLRDVHRLDICTGEIELVAENPGDVSGWVLSASGAVFATSQDDDGNERLSRWDPAAGLVELTTFVDGERPVTLSPREASASGDALLVGSSRDTEQVQLVRVDAVDGRETVVASHQTLSVDVTARAMPGLIPPALIKRRRDGVLLAVRFLG
jgi:dipeptidyl aminopeptidase/acylaminoacyl peptidase